MTYTRSSGEPTRASTSVRDPPQPFASVDSGHPSSSNPSLTTLPIRHAAGPGDLVAFKSVRVRWNTWNERAEACTGWASDVEVLARATDVLGRTMGLFQPRGANVWGANVYVDAGRVEALRAWARREHAQLLEIAADAQLSLIHI